MNDFSMLVASILSSLSGMGIAVWFLKQFIEETKRRIEQINALVSINSSDIEKAHKEIMKSAYIIKETILDRMKDELKDMGHRLAKEIEVCQMQMNITNSKLNEISRLESRIMVQESKMKTHDEALSILAKKDSK